MNANMREGEGLNRNKASLFYLLFSFLSCFDLYDFYKHDVFFFYYELTH